MKNRLNSYKFALPFSLLFFLPAISWVFFSDKWFLSPVILQNTEKYRKIYIIEHACFVVAMAIMIFVMIWFATKKINKTKHEYKNLFDNHPNPMWIYDIATLNFVAVNTAAIIHYGYSRKEFLNMSITDIRPPTEVPRLVKTIKAYQRGMDESSIWRHRKKNGKLITVHITANDVEFNEKKCRLISVLDVTEKMQKEAEIKKLSLVAENATNSIIILDKFGYIEWVNEAFSFLTGYDIEEVRGKRPQDFLHDAESNKKAIAEILVCMKLKKPFSGEMLNYRKNGSHFWIRLTISPVLLDDEITNFVIIQTDISSIKQQNKNLRDIAFSISHKFRKPLANILGLIYIMKPLGHIQRELDYLKQSADELDECSRELDEELKKIAKINAN